MFDLLAIDWGSKRTGLAIGSTSTQLVIPYKHPVITKDIWVVIAELIKEKKITTIILGLPTTFDLRNTEVTNSILAFQNELHILYPTMKIITVNENNTTKNQIDIKNKHDKNHLAALEIANIYLNNK
jgi:RNase H-fold protein (predicted Holliday junction resolvase)